MTDSRVPMSGAKASDILITRDIWNHTWFQIQIHTCMHKSNGLGRDVSAEP